MADVFGIGISAMRSLQRAISTTGHNIANVNTEGYSRQEVVFATREPQREGGHFLGSGTYVQSVRRAYDEFLEGQLQSRKSSFNSLKTYHDLVTRLDNLVADQDSGLNVSIQVFFQSLQDVVNDPPSLPARETLLSRAQVLENRVGYMHQSLESLEKSSNERLESTIVEINVLSNAIAKLNVEVSAGVVSDPNNPPNDLLDKRDKLIGQLSEKIGIITTAQSDGAINVSIGSGQPLIVDGQVQMLGTVYDPLIPNRLEVAFVGLGDSSDVISDRIRGGEIQGILDFRSRVLDRTRSEIGLLVQGITELVNQQHQQGIDLNGQVGGNFFTPMGVQTIASSDNTGTASVAVAIEDVTALQATDYRLSFNGAQWTLRSLSDNSVQTFGSLPISVNGVTVSSTGVPAAGDEFLLRPVGTASSLFSVEIARAEQFAAASPLRGQATVSNGGDATLSDLQVGDASSLPLTASITLTFDTNAIGSGVPGFVVAGGPGGTLAYDPATESGGKTFTLAGFGDATFTVSGIPVQGDTLTLNNNSGGVGDNSNVLALAGLQSARLLNGGTTTLSELYGRTVANIGVRTSQAQTNLSTEQAMLNNAEQEAQSISGVNLDEEAANLLRYQQAYQATAQIISAASQLFDSLLSAVRR